MKILVACDSFKESLSSKEIVDVFYEISKDYKKIEVQGVPISDGGEGMLDSIIFNNDVKKIECDVVGPLGKQITASYLYSKLDNKAFIEISKVVGLHLVSVDERNPFLTTTYGVGELIMDASKRGALEIVVGLGGSSTNDGGAGMLMALGVKFLNTNGDDISLGNYGLGEIHSIINCIPNHIRKIKFKVASDVTNKLLGANGATYVYSKQKGAKDNDLKKMEDNMTHFVYKTKNCLGYEINNKYCGAAGGLGAAFKGYLKSDVYSGFSIISEIVQLEDKIKRANIIITGEGKLDSQSKYGKAPIEVLKLSKKHNKKAIAIAGIVEGDYKQYIDNGFSRVYQISDKNVTLEENLSNAKGNLERLVRIIFEKVCEINGQ